MLASERKVSAGHATLSSAWDANRRDGKMASEHKATPKKQHASISESKIANITKEKPKTNENKKSEK